MGSSKRSLGSFRYCTNFEAFNRKPSFRNKIIESTITKKPNVICLIYVFNITGDIKKNFAPILTFMVLS